MNELKGGESTIDNTYAMYNVFLTFSNGCNEVMGYTSILCVVEMANMILLLRIGITGSWCSKKNVI